ncbi:cell adhesion molecule CEACAM5-like [Haliotis cracherodii]|uniref:cell adhesion molecule CEACAM5-like n=1 Tax=Haliotis cracherodii TaxID=6455 RepID=UPI0039E8C3C0
MMLSQLLSALLVMPFASCSDVTLNGSSEYAVLSKPFQFTCTTTNSSLPNLLIFKRNNDIVCTVSLKRCGQFSATPGYICGCGSSGEYYMTITMIRLRDNASWACQHKEKSESLLLPVYFGPVGVNISGNNQVIATEDLTLICTTTSYVSPIPVLTWRNSTNGSVLSGSSSVPVGPAHDGGYVYRSTLILTTQWYQDNNTITCEGSSIKTQDNVSESVLLDITYPPQNRPSIYGIENTPLYEGDTITLMCRVTGGRPVVSKIIFTCPEASQNSTTTNNGSDTRVTSLTFSVTRKLTSEHCLCSAEHSTGKYLLTANITKDVYYPPIIGTVSVFPTLPWVEGGNGSLTCVLSDVGNPETTYRWYRNNITILNTNQIWPLSALKDSDDSIDVKCQAENQFTIDKHLSLESPPVTLNVFFSPQVEISPPVRVTVIEGTPLSVNCTSTSNPPTPPTGYQWAFESGIEFNGSLLFISNVDRSDHGEYTCNATTQSGSFGTMSGSETIDVIVNYAPDVSGNNVTQHETKRATVRCQADGRPGNFTFTPFVHTWRGQFIRNVTGTKTGGQYEKRFASRFEDSGMYACEVTNGIADIQGGIQQVANISVQINASPKLTVGMRRDERFGKEVGDSVTLFRTFYIQPRYTNYSWLKGEQRLSSRTHVVETPVQLDIYGVIVEDMGFNFTINIGGFDSKLDTGRYALTVCNVINCQATTIVLVVADSSEYVPPCEPEDRIYSSDGDIPTNGEMLALSHVSDGAQDNEYYEFINQLPEKPADVME